MKKTIALLAVAMSSSVTLAHADDWKLAYKEPGGGFSFTSPDENFALKFLGYIQANQKFYLNTGYNNNPGNPVDYPYSFLVRRARFDIAATAFKNYEFFMELDAAPTAGILPVALHVSLPLYEDYLKLRAGRFITPFSAEDNISSRNLETIERSMVETSLIGLPSNDSQIGLMLYGSVFEKSFSYALSLTNGSNSSNSSIVGGTPAVTTPGVENNGSKDIQAHLSYKVLPELTVGAGYNYDVENTQTLAIKDLAGATYLSGLVVGQRQAYEGDLFYKMGDFSFRGEYIAAVFSDAAGNPTLNGFFAQAGYFVTGSELKGFQPIVRFEQDGITPSGVSANTLTTVTLGYNWFINSCVRHQLNLVNTSANNAIATANYADGNSKQAILSEIQFKF